MPISRIRGIKKPGQIHLLSAALSRGGQDLTRPTDFESEAGQTEMACYRRSTVIALMLKSQTGNHMTAMKRDEEGKWQVSATH